MRCTGVTDGVARFELQAAQSLSLVSELGALAHARGWQVGELQACSPTLEEIFLALTEPQDSTVHAGA